MYILSFLDSCSDDTWRIINNDCFKIMDSPRLFGNASVLCLETGGVLLSYKNRQVLSDLDITSPTWLENSMEMDNITYGLHSSLEHKNLTSGQRCPSFSPNSTLISFDCDALSTVVCQLKHTDTERGKGSLAALAKLKLKLDFYYFFLYIKSFCFIILFSGIHLKLLVAIVISGVIFVIFLVLIIYSAKRRLDDVEGREPNTVVYGKYRHLHQTEVEKSKTFTDDTIVLKDISTPVNGERCNGVPGEESVRIKHGKYVQFSVPSTESEQATFNT